MQENITYKAALIKVVRDMPKFDAFKQSEILAILFDMDCENTMDDIIHLREKIAKGG